MAINYIQGQILANNLQRNGVDLAFDTDLVYLDVGANSVGINTTTPASTLEVVGNITVGNILIPNVGNVSLGNTYINNLLDPVNNQDAATKKYVLDNVGNIGTAGNLNFSNTTINQLGQRQYHACSHRHATGHYLRHAGLDNSCRKHRTKTQPCSARHCAF
jgi:hypothetical protein